jgi:hypothetical protein
VVVVIVDDIGVDDRDVANDGDGDGGDDWLVGFSLLVCMAISQVLGASVDIPMSFSRHSVLSVGTVCIMALAVQAADVVVWVLQSAWTSFLWSHVALSASLLANSPFLNLMLRPSLKPSERNSSNANSSCRVSEHPITYPSP